ncbi:riboflavin synthase [Paenibacillus flagellatus]|uniref:Riboflavin synthase n=1 Tax=Paenibacillus flagellatus TaxID=2211139 RepID=A0A2V5K6G4_9BACL|nr:riboflavin synthase [Paenibacillus flagellatus]PYI54999.1 riboflavin synthase [Paenibacillus flagellatus]
MFTGIVEEVGRMRRIAKQGQSMVLTIEAAKVLEDVGLGDSISVNGVCLTVVQFDGASFTVDVMPETFRKTTLSQLQPGSRVNLERAMPANGRFGGHIVQGHVDTPGRIVSRQPEENAVVFRIEPTGLSDMKYVIPHGSITLDGISLTVVSVDERTFTVSIIPHTLAQTVLQHKQPGDTVNIEYDLLGKYIDRLLSFRGGAAEGAAGRGGGLTMEFLSKHGFM